MPCTTPENSASISYLLQWDIIIIDEIKIELNNMFGKNNP